MASAARKVKAIFFTYPHCDIPNEDLLELIKDHKKFRGDIKYCIIANEHHQDGEEHKHALVMTYHEKYYSRVEFESEFDLFKEWKVEETETKSIRWMWLHRSQSVTWVDDYIAAGKDIEDENLKGTWHRRFHCNIEPSKGPKGIIEYCKKEGEFIEFGDSPIKTKTRKDRNKELMERPILDLVESGEVSIYSVYQLKRCRELIEDERIHETFEKKHIKWFCGPTGAGKTREAWEEALKEVGGNIEECWVSHTTAQWYDGYRGQKCVIIDDIRAGSWPFAELLRITDRYPIQVPVKGGFRKWTPRFIWITAPGRPEEVYCDHSTGRVFDGIEQLLRRIDETREFEEPSVDADTAPIDSFIQKDQISKQPNPN